MKAAARKALKTGIVLFNAGRYKEAERSFLASSAAGGGKEAEFCLEHVRKSLAPQAAAAPAGAPAVESLVRRLASKRDAAAAFRVFEELFARDASVGYRMARDFWLSGGLNGLAGKKNGSAWHGFFLSSEAWQTGDSAGALRLLDAASRSAARYRWMRYYIAEILLRRHDHFAFARREIEQVLRDCPWLWEARCLRAEILLAMGSDKGLAALSRVKVPEGSEPAFFAWRGALRLWAGDAAKALPDLDAAQARGNPDALCWRGGARVLLGRLDEGLADLDRLLSLDPKDPEALVWRAEGRRRAGRRQLARADLDAAIKLYPDSIWAFVNRALLSLEESDLKGARADFARLAPPSYAGAAGSERSGGATPPGYAFAELPLGPARLKSLLRSVLRLARGCRRADTHLNVAWMAAAGIPLPKVPAPQARLLYWMRSKGLPTPPELVFGPGTLSERQARVACGRLTAGAKAGGSSRSSPS